MNLRWLVVIAALVLGGCIGLDGPRTLHVDRAELQSQLARHFPLRRSVAGLVELELSAPRLRLLPQSNRLATAFVFTAGNRMNGREISGDVELEYGLRYDAEAAAIRLEQPQILRFDAGAHRALRLQEPAKELIEAALAGMTLYRVPRERLQALRAAGLQPGAITVTDGGVDVQLEALPSGGSGR